MTVKILILIYTINAIVSQLLLKKAVTVIGSPSGASELPKFLLTAAMSPWVQASVVLQVVGYALWIVVISKEKLGVAFALAASTFYVLLSLSAWAIYDERLTLGQWAGVLLITLGVVALTLGAPTSARAM